MPYSPELEAAAEALIAPNPGPRLGPYFLGFFCDAILLGVILMMFFRWQTWNAAKEPIVIKLLVYYVMASGLAYSLFLAAVNMRLFALHFGQWWIFLDGGMIRYSFFLETSARTPVSIYFAYRAWKFGGRNLAFGTIVMALIIASAGGAIWATADFESLSPADKGSYAPIFIWCGSEVVSDIMITAFLAYHLHRSRTGWKKTDGIITQLIVMAMETQLPPLMVVTAYMIIVIQNPSSPNIAFFSFVPSTYILSLLVVLNKRLVLRRVLDHETSSYRGRTKETYGVRARRTVIPANIQVTTETVRRVDDGGQPGEFDTDKGAVSPGTSLHRLDYSTSKTKLTQPDV